MLVETALRGWRFQSGAVQDSGLHSQWLNPWRQGYYVPSEHPATLTQWNSFTSHRSWIISKKRPKQQQRQKGKQSPATRTTHGECLLRPHYGFGCRGDRQTTGEYGAMRWKVTIHSSMDLVSTALRLVSFSVLPYGAVVTARAMLVNTVHSYGWRDFRKLPELGPS